MPKSEVYMKQESTVDLLLDVDQRPSAGKGILLSFQHVFAMFGATILVPLILGMPVSVALFASGVGTLIYMIATGFRVPVYLGSSFAFITAMSLAMKELGGDVSAAQTGVILTGFIYVLVAASVRFAGTKWIDKLLPPMIIGPMIIVIGLGLAGSGCWPHRPCRPRWRCGWRVHRRCCTASRFASTGAGWGPRASSPRSRHRPG